VLEQVPGVGSVFEHSSLNSTLPGNVIKATLNLQTGSQVFEMVSGGSLCLAEVDIEEGENLENKVSK